MWNRHILSMYQIEQELVVKYGLVLQQKDTFHQTNCTLFESARFVSWN